MSRNLHRYTLVAPKHAHSFMVLWRQSPCAWYYVAASLHEIYSNTDLKGRLSLNSIWQAHKA